MSLGELVRTSQRIAERGGRLEKTGALAEYLERLPKEDVATAVSYLAGELPQGRIGVGWAMVSQVQQEAAERAAAETSLTLREVDDTLTAIAGTSGPGSTAHRRDRLAGLLQRATVDEQRFLSRLLLGELRQGAQEGVMLEAVSRAARVPLADLRRAAMLAGDLTAVARAVLTQGPSALASYRVEVFRPLQPMLAQPTPGFGDAFERHDRLGLEYKIDGARVQVHRRGDQVRVWSRRLKEVTHAVPEVVEAVLALDADELILDGEAIALRPDGSPQPFQITMRRFGRKLDTDSMRLELPLAPFFFDCLYRDGETLIDAPTAARWEELERLVPAPLQTPRRTSETEADAEAFLREALDRGHEGIMAKALDAPYEAGSRGYSWLKIKPAHTLDLVILAAEWGSGRRRGKLSNLHLGARRDGTTDQFVMLGKTFKGLTDKMLAWQTERLLGIEVARQGHVVHVRPEVVVEIAFNDVQASPQYPGGVALRFARVKGYRTDKSAAEADTLAAVQALHDRAHRA